MITRFSSKIFSAILFIGFAAFSASAAEVVVTNAGDPSSETGSCLTGGDCSLREAINASVDGGLITFNLPAANCPNNICTVSITRGSLAISRSLVILGTGARNLIIQRIAAPSNNAFRVFVINAPNNSMTVRISGMTVSNGFGQAVIGDENGGEGGGISNTNATLTLNSVNVKNNYGAAVGGIYNTGVLTMFNSLVANNTGDSGGILNSGVGATANIYNSTIQGNTAFGANGSGGITNGLGGLDNATLNLTNVTVTQNEAIYGNANPNNVGGILNRYTARLRNTIIIGNNTFVNERNDLSGTFYMRNNLIGDARFITGVNAPETHNVIVQSANLGALANNGGQTDTIALTASSPAIEAGDNCVLNKSCEMFNAPNSLTADQRGTLLFQRQFGTNVDIGAFEFQGGKNQFDFDADKKADLSVYHPSNNSWYVQQTTNGVFAFNLGQSGDKLAPADFDGDGKTDLAVYRPSSGDWLIRRSSDSQTYTVNFGAAEDIPVPADFDGDGKADVSVFRPSNGVWYRLNSSTGAFVANGWGISGDKPAIGDFDGDGKSDLAVYRPSNGVWYIVNSSTNNYTIVGFGAAEDLVVPADYDGDGKTDIAVFRPSTNNWYRLNSSNGAFAAVNWGAAGDKPVPADYDGDGKTDVAVYRNGYWYIIQSTNGQIGYGNFGDATDTPLPNTYVR